MAAAATTASAFVFDDRTDTSLLEPRDKKILDPVLEDREDIDYYEGTDLLILLRLLKTNLDGYVKEVAKLSLHLFSYRSVHTING